MLSQIPRKVASVITAWPGAHLLSFILVHQQVVIETGACLEGLSTVWPGTVKESLSCMTGHVLSKKVLSVCLVLAGGPLASMDRRLVCVNSHVLLKRVYPRVDCTTAGERTLKLLSTVNHLVHLKSVNLLEALLTVVTLEGSLGAVFHFVKLQS